MTDEQVKEFEYLEYFYDRVRDALGPADDDIYAAIADDYEATTGKELPAAYRRD